MNTPAQGHGQELRGINKPKTSVTVKAFKAKKLTSKNKIKLKKVSYKHLTFTWQLGHKQYFEKSKIKAK